MLAACSHDPSTPSQYSERTDLSEVDDQSVIVSVCKHSSQVSNSASNSYRYHLDNYKDSTHFEQSLFSDFGRDSSTCSVVLHVPGSCADTLPLDYVLSGALKENAWPDDIIHTAVCFQPRNQSRKKIKISHRKSEDLDEVAVFATPATDIPDPDRKMVLENRYYYVRIGRRTVEDTGGSIPARSLVVARIDPTKRKVAFLAVFTWLLNGLRIGDHVSGDVIKENDHFDLSICLDPDPFWFSRNLVSPMRIRKWLLTKAETGCLRTLDTCEEIKDDEVAAEQRSDAAQYRLAAEMKRDGRSSSVRRDDSARDAKMKDVLSRFPSPWCLPFTPQTTHKIFPRGLKAFDSTSHDWRGGSIDVVAVLVNEGFEENLRLTHHVQPTFEPGETFEQAKSYFWNGDSGFAGLASNKVLRVHHWQLELWVLPQVKGCSKLYLWNNVPKLRAQDFCDTKAVVRDGIAALYVEVRIVQDPERLDDSEQE